MESLGQVHLEGTSNLRDLGPHVTVGGVPLARGRVFRSANLDKASEGDWQRLRALGVTTLVDFRGREEAAAAPEMAGVTRMHLPIEPTVMAELRRRHEAGALDVAAAVSVMEDTYRHFVVGHPHVYAALLHRVAESGKGAVLFHCAAGKDRTGLAAALILSALDVDRAAIAEDYLISNQLYRPGPPTFPEIAEDVRDTVRKVRPSYLAAAFAAMDEGWGGVDGYLAKALSIGPSERRALHAALT